MIKMSEYIALKEQIDNLMKTIEGLEEEAISFSVAKKELNEVAKQLASLSEGLSLSANASNELLEQINKLAVDETLAKFRQLVDDMSQSADELESRIGEKIQDVKKTEEGIAEDVHKFMDDVKKTEERIAEDIQKFMDDTKKKVYMLGGGAILIAVIALVLAFIP